jgi:hypothetical protein
MGEKDEFQQLKETHAARTAVVSKAIELFIPDYYRNHSEFLPKKETEENVRRFLDWSEDRGRCCDFLAQNRFRNDVYLIGDGKGTSVGGVESQFGATAAALLCKEPVAEIHCELFILHGSLPKEFDEMFPAVRSPGLINDKQLLRMVAGSVKDHLALADAAALGDVQLGGTYRAVGQNHLLVDTRGQAIQPELPALPPIAPAEWQRRNWAAQAGKFAGGIEVRFLNFRV